MPFDSNGVAVVSGNRPVNGQDTDAAQINVPLADIQSMLSQLLLKSGVAPMQGNLNMNGFSIAGLSDPSNSDDPVTLSYLNSRLTQSGVPTGARLGFFALVAPTGWVVADGRTIGNLGSNATNRAALDTFNLFSLLWSSFPSLPIYNSARTLTTRGSSFSADWNANKALSLFDLRSEYDRGADAGRGIIPSSAPGSSLSDQIRSHNHTGVTSDSGNHSHGISLYGGSGGGFNTGGASSGPLGTDSTSISQAGNHAHSFTTTSTGGDETRPRTVATLHCIKL